MVKIADAPEAPEGTSAANEEWEDIKVGLGREWDLEQDGAIVGVFMGMQTIDVDDKQSDIPGTKRATAAYAIEVRDSNDPNRFIWGSYNIDQGMAQVNVGDTVRIEFLGVDSFQGPKGPQTVKTYRIQRKVAS